LSDLLVKKVGGAVATPNKTISEAPATPAAASPSPAQTPSSPDTSYTSTPPPQKQQSPPPRSSPETTVAPSRLLAEKLNPQARDAEGSAVPEPSRRGNRATSDDGPSFADSKPSSARTEPAKTQAAHEEPPRTKASGGSSMLITIMGLAAVAGAVVAFNVMKRK